MSLNLKVGIQQTDILERSRVTYNKRLVFYKFERNDFSTERKILSNCSELQSNRSFKDESNIDVSRKQKYSRLSRCDMESFLRHILGEDRLQVAQVKNSKLNGAHHVKI